MDVGFLLVQEVVPALVVLVWHVLGVFLVAYDGASASNGISNATNTGGVMTSNGGRSATFLVTSKGPVDTTILGTTSFTSCAVFGRGLLMFWW